MSGLRGDDDGGRKPPDPDGLPGFPPEWGRIVIPDDAAELDRESARVRRELRREALFRRYGLVPNRRLHHLALPLILLTMAVLVTTTSLFAAMWPQSHRTTNGTTQPTNPPTSTGRASATSRPGALRTGAQLPDLTFTDPKGHRIRLRDTRPAVVLLTRDCGCTALITDTARTALRAKVTVLVIGGASQPHLPALPGDTRLIGVADPAGALADAVAVGAAHRPAANVGAALLVDAKGRLVTSVPATTSAATFSKQIAGLAG